MSKLLKLKSWLTLDQAAVQLSQSLGEPVEVSDLLQLALEKHLRLSVRFVNHVRAHLGKVIPISQATSKTIPGLDGKPITLLNGTQISNEEVAVFDEEVVTIEGGIWDLPMIGGEQLDVAQRYQDSVGGPNVELFCIDGTFVMAGENQIVMLLDRFTDKKTPSSNNGKLNFDDPTLFYPAGGLPEDSELVVRPSALAEFQLRLSEQDGSSPKEVSRKSESSYQHIIGALLAYIEGKVPRIGKHPAYENDSKLYEVLAEHFKGFSGLSVSNLSRKFPESRRSLDE